MGIKDYFERFWNARASYLNINNPDRTHNNLVGKLSTFDDFTQIDDYVCSLRTNKESTRRIMVAFFDYLKDKEGIAVESILYNKRFYNHPMERQLEMAKFLHEPRTARDIDNKFDIDARTRRNDLQALEDGVEILGSTVRIYKEKVGRKYYYKATMHPIFLALNLTEVNAITNVTEIINSLERALKRGENAYSIILRDTVNRIKAQLSPYAFSRLFPGERQPEGNYYLNEESLAKTKEHALGYLHKSGKHFKFIYKDEEYGGRIRPIFGDFEILLDDGSVLNVGLEEIEVIMDSYEYE